MLNLRELEAFRALMLAGSVTGAAEMLRVTQPTISKFVAQLERRNKVALFDRERGRLIPRQEAHRLLALIEKVFSAAEEVERGAKFLSRTDVGRIRIVAVPPVALGLLPIALEQFSKMRPDVQVTIDIRGSSYISEWLTTDQADIGFVSGRPRLTALSTEPLYKSAAVCVLARGHALAQVGALSPIDLAGERFIVLGRETAFQHDIDRVFDDAEIARTVSVRTGYSATACALAAKGIGVTIVDPISAFCRWEVGDASIRRFAPSVDYECSALALPQTWRSPLLAELLACVNEAAIRLERKIVKAIEA